MGADQPGQAGRKRPRNCRSVYGSREVGTHAARTLKIGQSRLADVLHAADSLALRACTQSDTSDGGNGDAPQCSQGPAARQKQLPPVQPTPRAQQKPAHATATDVADTPMAAIALAELCTLSQHMSQPAAQPSGSPARRRCTVSHACVSSGTRLGSVAHQIWYICYNDHEACC